MEKCKNYFGSLEIDKVEEKENYSYVDQRNNRCINILIKYLLIRKTHIFLAIKYGTREGFELILNSPPPFFSSLLDSHFFFNRNMHMILSYINQLNSIREYENDPLFREDTHRTTKGGGGVILMSH